MGQFIEASSFWEHGSDFHWPDYSEILPVISESTNCHMPLNAVFFSSGRAALTAIIRKGVSVSGWRRIWFPTYYCKDVIEFIKDCEIELVFYDDVPFAAPRCPQNVRTGDVFLIVNYFGLRERSDYNAFYEAGLPIIEDHTHDPWSEWAKDSKANYLMVSYRKYLPVPDGAAVWSKIKSPLIIKKAELRNSRTALLRFQAMLLKSLYLKYGKPDKEAFLSLFKENEKSFNNRSRNTISLLSKHILNTIPWDYWHEMRKSNYNVLCNRLRNDKRIEIIKPSSPDLYPYSFVITFCNSKLRDKVLSKLISQSVYPAILWPLENADQVWAGKNAVEWSGRMLSIHCDARYSMTDMNKVADILIASL